MKSTTHYCWMATGSPKHADCEDFPGVCWVCGGDSARTMPRANWLGASYTGQNRVRAPSSTRICEPCVWLHSRTFPVPGRPPKEGNSFGGNWRNYSVMVEMVSDVPALITASKGEKATIRAWLERPKNGAWFCAIAESGQKHVIPSAPINRGARGRVAFEDRIVILPDGGRWGLLAALCEALTAGLSKESLSDGNYSPMQWRDNTAEIESFEAAWSSERGGAWFELALFLAQRDEEKYDERRKSSSTKRGRESAAGTTKTVPSRRRKPTEALGPTAERLEDREPGQCDRPGVLFDPVQNAPPVRTRQLGLFGE